MCVRTRARARVCVHVHAHTCAQCVQMHAACVCSNNALHAHPNACFLVSTLHKLHSLRSVRAETLVPDTADMREGRG